MGQEPVHDLPNMPLPEPAPCGGKAPGKRRRGLGRVPPLASEQQQEPFIDQADGGSHLCRERTGRHGIGREDASLGEQPELPRRHGWPAQPQGATKRQGGLDIRQRVRRDATPGMPVAIWQGASLRVSV
jgi:hypothetical protein